MGLKGTIYFNLLKCSCAWLEELCRGKPLFLKVLLFLHSLRHGPVTFNFLVFLSFLIAFLFLPFLSQYPNSRVIFTYFVTS